MWPFSSLWMVFLLQRPFLSIIVIRLIPVRALTARRRGYPRTARRSAQHKRRHNDWTNKHRSAVANKFSASCCVWFYLSLKLKQRTARQICGNSCQRSVISEQYCRYLNQYFNKKLSTWDVEEDGVHCFRRWNVTKYIYSTTVFKYAFVFYFTLIDFSSCGMAAMSYHSSHTIIETTRQYNKEVKLAQTLTST